MTSFIAKRRNDREVVELLIGASEFAVSALERLIQQAGKDVTALKTISDRYSDMVFDLEVTYLFPNLTDVDRARLASILKMRNAIGAQLSGLATHSEQLQYPDGELAPMELKVKFFKLRQEILNSGIGRLLLPAQNRVLEDEFISIPLDREEPTSLFFKDERPVSVSPQPEAKASEPPLRSESASKRSAPSQAEPLSPRDQNALTSAKRHSKPGPESHSPADPFDRLDLAGRKTILVIDEDRAWTETLETWLQPEGYDIISADEGLAGYELAVNRHPSLVLLDVGISSGGQAAKKQPDGFSLLKLLSRIPCDQAAPVIAISRGPARENKARAIASGAVAFLQKSLGCKRLLGAVQVALDDTCFTSAKTRQMVSV